MSQANKLCSRRPFQDGKDVTSSPSADNRSLLGGGANEDRIATGHFLFGAFFLAVGGFLYMVALASLHFAEVFPISYGRFESMANLSLMIGFAVTSLVGGIYYVLPRLTGARLWGTPLARAGLWALSGLTVAGLILTALGFGDGRAPLNIPWWLHIPMVFTVAIPAVVTVGTLFNRTEPRSFVTLGFVIGGVTWLPLLYLAYFGGGLFGSVGETYSDLFFTAGFITMFLFTVGAGLFYYTLVKEIDIPLASKQLASVGFWSLGFAGVWWGVSQLVFGPGPDWIAGVAAALGLAFPIGALANAANVSLTLEGHWEELREEPGIASGVVGLYLVVGIAVMAAFASFPAVGSVTALTGFWEAIEFAALAGAGPLLIAGISFKALPRITGREHPNPSRARAFNVLTILGSIGVLVSLATAGIVHGYSWTAGSNAAAYVDAGEGWAAGAGTADVLMFIAVGFGAVSFIGHLVYAQFVAGTVFSGKAVEQEVLVDAGVSDE